MPGQTEYGKDQVARMLSAALDKNPALREGLQSAVTLVKQAISLTSDAWAATLPICGPCMPSSTARWACCQPRPLPKRPKTRPVKAGVLPAELALAAARAFRAR
ncbi:MAG: hypothetical protein HC793_01440 [Aquincola sp.]|nr:hypothetical protein [Aquincola sp.]